MNDVPRKFLVSDPIEIAIALEINGRYVNKVPTRRMLNKYKFYTLKRGCYVYYIQLEDNKRIPVYVGCTWRQTLGHESFTSNKREKLDIALTKVKGGRKQIQVKWKKNKKVTGYQIAYSLTKDFAIWEDKIVRDPKKTGVTIKGLKSKTTYYVRIRTYKRLNGRRHWSPWSDYMKVKTK